MEIPDSISRIYAYPFRILYVSDTGKLYRFMKWKQVVVRHKGIAYMLNAESR